MKIIKNILIGFFVSIFLLVIGFMIVLNMYGTGSTTGGGGDRIRNQQYEISEPMIVKNLLLPKGTRLIYEFKSDNNIELDKPLEERYIKEIWLPEENPISWGGIPVFGMRRLENGYLIFANWRKLDKMEDTKFLQLWEQCVHGFLQISIKNIEDWSFSIGNISNITNCGDYYYDNGEQHKKFLDSLYIALKNANQPVELKKKKSLILEKIR